MRRRRPTEAEARRGIPLRLQSFRAEEWPPGTTRHDWYDAREEWEETHGVDLPTFDETDRNLAEEWHWRQGRWATPEEWRAELFAWEDEHGRLRTCPHAPFEPAGRGMYDLGSGTWQAL